MKHIKNLLLVGLSCAIVFGFFLFGLICADGEYSMAERRTLAQRPEISAEALKSGSFMSKFEDYTLDQFPLRDSFRSLRANLLHYVFRQKDNHGLYLQNGYLSRLEYPANQPKLDASRDKLTEIRDTFLAGTDCRLFLSIVPDKNFFLAPRGGYPTLDYEKVVADLKAALPEAQYLDIFGSLSLSDYYFTDQHWRQEAILPAAKVLAEGMGGSLGSFREVALDVPFYGAYYGQAALNVQADTLRYLTSDTLESLVVTSYNTGKPKSAVLYDLSKAAGRDPYEMFLCGSDALVTVENPNAGTQKELVVFRDSFGSTMVPLLCENYAKVTLVDLRYLDTALLPYFVTFENQDVLFLYSTLVLNNTISK